MNHKNIFNFMVILGILVGIASGCGGCDEVGAGPGYDDDAGLRITDLEDVYEGGTDVGGGDADVGGGDGEDEGDGDEEEIEREPCEEHGEVRRCGSDVGECEQGAQVCVEGFWGDCGGGIQPARERCSGLDESCTGVADDGPDEELCASTSPCLGNGRCVDGECEFEQIIDCSHLDSPCTVGMCEAKSGTCYAVPVENNTACDDGDFCTVDGVCQEGECLSSSRDCSAAGDSCNEGVCDSALEACVPVPVSDGISCDDGLFCTVNSSCSDGQCLGAPRDCSSFSDQCNDAFCDEDAGSCEVAPVVNGTNCSDGLYCTVNTICTDGVCGGGEERQCGAAGGTCSTGVCDESIQGCLGDPLPDGTSCDDGNFCTVNTSCVDGLCAESTPRDCSNLDDACNIGVCDAGNSRCTTIPRADGTSCDDGNYCTVNNACNDGQCVGQPRDCSEFSDQCNNGVCSVSAQACVAQPTNVGQSCDDSFFCTVNTVCTDQGTCEGAARDCSFLDEVCQAGICDESAAACMAMNLADGTPCEDGLYCTVNEACVAGSCVVEPRDCSHLSDGDCLEGFCSESQESCTAIDICDPCDAGLPTANAGADQEVPPNTVVSLDGTGSSDVGGQSLSYQWEITARPSGSSANLSNPTSATPTLLADVAGEFTVCLTVENPDLCVSEADCMTITVRPVASLHIELTWSDSPTADLDLHYRAPNGTWFSRRTHPPGQADCGPDQQADSVWFCVPNPDWGGGADGSDPDGVAENDPYLDVDNLTGDGPENINQDVLFDGSGFRVGVHHWWDYENGPKEGRVRIYVNGELEFEESHTIGCGDFWEVADLDVSNGGTEVTITSLNRQTAVANVAGAPCP